MMSEQEQCESVDLTAAESDEGLLIESVCENESEKSENFTAEEIIIVDNSEFVETGKKKKSEKKLVNLCNEANFPTDSGEILSCTHARLKYLFEVLEYYQEKQPLNQNWQARPAYLVRDFYVPSEFFDVPRFDRND
jgi:hypothetical protein